MLPEPQDACRQLKPDDPVKFKSRSLVVGFKPEEGLAS